MAVFYGATIQQLAGVTIIKRFRSQTWYKATSEIALNMKRLLLVRLTILGICPPPDF
jgi:hypothetical protein